MIKIDHNKMVIFHLNKNNTGFEGKFCQKINENFVKTFFCKG